MGYCTYGGKLVPGNNRASCIGGGGNWVEGETGPTSQLGSKPMGLPTPPVGKQFSGGPAQGYWDTDDFGAPLDYNTGPQGGTYNLFGERDRLLARSEADNFGSMKASPALLPGSMVSPDTGKALEMTGINPEWDKPIEDATMDLVAVGYLPAKGALGAGKIAYKLLATPKGILLTGYGADKYFKNKEEADAWIAEKTKEATAKAKTTLGVTDTPTPAPTDTTTTTKTDKGTGAGTNVSNANGTGTPTGEDVQKMGKTGEIPKGLLDRMGTKDYWLKGMEGGSGGWDNRLFRLGEMMSYMGTPLSKRGDNPAKRWTSASTAADKLKAEIAKAGNKKTGNIFGKIPTQAAKDTVMSELKKEPWFLGFGQQFNDEELEAMGNKGEMIYIEWMENGATATQALEETLKELKLGL